jgi:predicted dehydrogenase
VNTQSVEKVRFGEIGVGYWGGNIVRNLAHMNSTEMSMVSDLDQGRLDHIKNLYPTVETTTDFRRIVESDKIDAVAIATPVSTHFDLASAALRHGKHVFLEKPMTLTPGESRELVEMADDAGKLCMVGHTFLYTPAVERMKELLDSGAIGNVQYISSRRMSLGLIQKSCNVVHDLAPHDISIICYLLGEAPVAVNAVGAAYVNPDIEEIASITLHFSNGIVAFVQNSWLDPLKIRNLTMVGDKKMVVYDDIHPTDKIQVHDKSVEKPAYSDTYGDFAYSYKYGDIVIPKLQGGEPIRRQLDHFVDCIHGNAKCRSSAMQGQKVVEIITCINESIKRNGARVAMEGGAWV